MKSRAKLYWILFVVIGLCIGIKILSIGWFTVIIGIFVYPAILIAHTVVHVMVLRRSVEIAPKPILISHSLLLLAFLLQVDAGDSAQIMAWTAVVWRLFDLAVRLPHWMFALGWLIGWACFVLVAISWWILLRRKSASSPGPSGSWHGAVPSARAARTGGRWGDPIPRILLQGLCLVLAVVAVIWSLLGFYRVHAHQQGVVLRFGEWVKTTPPGLNWHFPYPIGTVVKLDVTRINRIDIGFLSLGAKRDRAQRRDLPRESLMLTGDQNIIDIDFTVFWRIKDAGNFLFEIRDPPATVKIAAESAMREIIGRTNLRSALTEGRRDIEWKARELLQDILDEYDAGIEITLIQLQDVKPPAPVIEAYDDCQRARQDRERRRNEAEKSRSPGTARPAAQ